MGLGNHNHDVLMVPFDETITLLRNNEEHIRNQVQNQKNTEALMKTVGLENGNKNNGSGNGGGNKTKKNRNGNSTKKGKGHKTPCKVCDKLHLGKCRFNDGNGNDIRKMNNNSNNNNNGGKGYKKTGFSKS